jgi:hypothetical protein
MVVCLAEQIDVVRDPEARVCGWGPLRSGADNRDVRSKHVQAAYHAATHAGKNVVALKKHMERSAGPGLSVQASLIPGHSNVALLRELDA